MRKMLLAATVLTLGLATAGVVSSSSRADAALADPSHNHGEKHKLGRKQIADYTVSVILIGEVEAGKHVDFDIKLYDGKVEPKALRVWIGTQDAAGSQKAAGAKGQVTYTGEVTAPDPIPAGSKLWVELETDAGVQSAAWDYDHHDHKH